MFTYVLHVVYRNKAHDPTWLPLSEGPSLNVSALHLHNIFLPVPPWSPTLSKRISQIKSLSSCLPSRLPLPMLRTWEQSPPIRRCSRYALSPSEHQIYQENLFASVQVLGTKYIKLYGLYKVGSGADFSAAKIPGTFDFAVYYIHPAWNPKTIHITDLHMIRRNRESTSTQSGKRSSRRAILLRRPRRNTSSWSRNWRRYMALRREMRYIPPSDRPSDHFREGNIVTGL